MTPFPDPCAVIGHWRHAIGHPAHCEPMNESHTAIRVTAASGHYILKEATLWPSPERLEAQHRILRHLDGCGVPVAVPLLAEDGRPYAAQAGKLYTLAPELPCDSQPCPAGPEATWSNTGQAIGRLHRALSSCPYEIESWTMDPPARILGRALPAIRARLGEPQAATLEQAFPQLLATLGSAFVDLPTQRIHGDCHGGNVLLCGGRVSGFVDLDHLPTGPRVYDLAYFLADMAKNRLGSPEQLAEWLKAPACLIAGYRQQMALTEREAKALWPGMLATQLLFVEWFLEHGDARLVTRNLDVFHWIHRHEREIRLAVE